MSSLNFQQTHETDIDRSNTREKATTKILSIQYLRGIAALLVVLFHSTALIGADWKTMLRNGMVGVDVFFIMSGFIIYYITSNRKEISPVVFFVKRFFRIFPVFFFVWLVVACVSYQDQPFINVIKSLFLFHVDYNASAPAFKFNLIGPAWTLSYEIYFYIIFCVAGAISYKYRGAIASAMLMSLPIIIQLYFNGSFSYAANIKAEFLLTSVIQSPLKILSNAMLWEFVGGILLAYLFVNHRFKIQSIRKDVRSVIAALLFCIFVYQIFLSPVHAQGIGGLFWPSLCLVAGALISEDLIKFNIKPLSFLGDISYSLYLSHWSIIKVFITFFPAAWNNRYGFIGLATFLFISILISYLMYLLIEKPSMRLARKILA